MAEAGGAEPGKPPPVASLERALDQVCDFLSRAEQTARVRALVIEARRLRNVVGNWRSIAPDPDVREEMIARVLRLANDAEDVVSAERQSAGQEEANGPPPAGPVIIRQDPSALAYEQRPPATGLRLGPVAPPGAPYGGQHLPPKGPTPGAALFMAGMSEHNDRGAPPPPALPPGPERPGAGAAVVHALDLSATLSSPSLLGAPAGAGSPSLPTGSPREHDSLHVDRVIAPPARDVGVHEAQPRRAAPQPLELTLSGAFPSPPSLVFDRVVPPAAQEGGAPEAPAPRPLERSLTGSFASPPSLVFDRVVPPPAQGNALATRPLARDEPFESPPSLHIEQVRSPSRSQDGLGRAPTFGPAGDPGPISVRPLPLPDSIDPRVVMIHAPYSPEADAYRTLRRKLSAGSATTIAVTSASPSEGKTVCAINLALAMCETVRGKILLVEANLRAPGIANALKFEPPSCFTEQLQHHREDRLAPWVVVELAAPAQAASPGDGVEPAPKSSGSGGRLPDPRLSLQTPVHVLAIDPRSEKPPMLDAVAFAAGIESLKRAGYTYIIIDTPPVLGSMDTNAIGDAVDGVILTSRVKRSTRKSLRQAIEQLRPAPILGVVLLDA